MAAPADRVTGGDRRPSWASVAFTAALLAFTLVLLLDTMTLQESASIVPRLVGIPLAVLLGWVLVLGLVQRPRREPPSTEAQPRDEASAVLWIVALPVTATLLGFVIGPALYVFASARWRGGERIGIALAAGAVTAAVVALVFGVLLGVRLPGGVFDL